MKKSVMGVLWGAVCLLLCGQTVRAVPIYINDPATVISSFGGIVGEARFKMDRVNWDMALGPNIGGGLGAITRNVGTATQISGTTYAFELRNDPVTGLIFSLSNGGNTYTTDWGQTLLNSGSGFVNSLSRAYDTIRITARATGGANRTATLTDLAFSYEGSGVYNSLSGLANMLVTPSTPASSFSNFPSDSAGSDSHWIATGPMANGTNLAALAWRLHGNVRLYSDLPGNANPNENVRMSISLIQYNWSQLPSTTAPSQVPEPETYLMMAGGLATLAALGKRRVRPPSAPRK